MLIKSLIFFISGGFLWTFSEYALHNWYGHKAKGKNEFSREHLAHHADTSYFAANWKKALATVKVSPFIFVFMSLLNGLLFGSIFTAGFLVTYLTYEAIHRRIHTHAPHNFYSRFIRKHHAYHHFANPRYNHGVTSPAWDLVFGTYKSHGIIRVPENNAMKWLFDENNNIRPEYSRDYQLIPKKSLITR
jgi:sterol desaturase/sphingolipid hydroxylase (fatty acid hydroxylase superfamily)